MSFDTKGLDALIKLLGVRVPEIRVGILGGGEREDGKLTNAEIGAIHEFGSPVINMPERSFLRIPLARQMPILMKNAKMDRAALNRVIRSGKLTPWCEKIAVMAEGVVLKAFDSGGYGLWPESNMAYKKNHQTLVETTQLRNSISSEVDDG